MPFGRIPADPRKSWNWALVLKNCERELQLESHDVIVKNHVIVQQPFWHNLPIILHICIIVVSDISDVVVVFPCGVPIPWIYEELNCVYETFYHLESGFWLIDGILEQFQFSCYLLFVLIIIHELGSSWVARLLGTFLPKQNSQMHLPSCSCSVVTVSEVDCKLAFLDVH